jgi:hypothetical protein
LQIGVQRLDLFAGQMAESVSRHLAHHPEIALAQAYAR